MQAVMLGTVLMSVNKEAYNEDDDARMVARYCFGRMCSNGSDSCANGNANSTYGNTYPTHRSTHEHARADSNANA